ncbi:MAG: tetraacyldisaccharide 4'-kinase [Odoribacter sp.]|nr:tetraacyldisaccharide 4'-kinase [Odoribacter sp.]
MGNDKNILLYPFSLIYGAVTGIRNFMYDAGILPHHEFRLPVICVGNITVGGTGKTPHTEYLAELLSKDFRVATLSRGYRRKSSGFRIASPSDNAGDIGDEPMQIHKKYPEVIVAVDRDRVNGVKSILKEKPETEVIILDDGFQHRRITPGFTILLTDFNRLMINDHLLPYGRLRESASNMNRADIILVTKSPENISPIQRRIIVKEINKAPYQNLYFTSIEYKDPLPVFEPHAGRKLSLSEQKREKGGIVLLTGIANPLPLKEYLSGYFNEIIHLPFPDHHKFTGKDIGKVSGAFNNLVSAEKFILTTEKDAVRLREFTNLAESIQSSVFYIPVGIKFLNDDKVEFDNLIIEYVRKNKRNNRVSESTRLQ